MNVNALHTVDRALPSRAMAGLGITPSVSATAPDRSAANARNDSIDTLRGIACLLLVAYHVAGTGYGSGSGFTLPRDHALVQFNDTLFYFRMPLFAFLSGFVYAWNPYRGDAKRFFTGKVRRLLVPMFIVGTVFALLRASVAGANDVDQQWWLMHIRPVGHYWFLESMFLIFLAVATAESLGWLRNEKSLAAIFAVAIVVHSFANPPPHFGLAGVVFLLPYFVFGLWLSRFRSEPWPTNVVAFMGAAALAVVAYHLLIGGEWDQEAHPLAAILSCYLCALALHVQPKVAALAWIGRASFAIFLMHVFFTAGTRVAYKLVLPDLPVNGVLAISFAAGILGPMICADLLRRLPPWGPCVIGERASNATSTVARTTVF